jgi:hypothetical protein
MHKGTVRCIVPRFNSVGPKPWVELKVGPYAATRRSKAFAESSYRHISSTAGPFEIKVFDLRHSQPKDIEIGPG